MNYYDLNKHPYFIYPLVMALREGAVDKEEVARLRRIIAANVGDIPSLRIILGIDSEEFAGFYPDMEKTTISTVDTIESFLSKFGNPNAPIPPVAAEITGSTLQEAEENSPTTTSGDFSENISPKPVISEIEARKMIKNHNYQRALEIIMQLSLNNPEKSIYFADQIRFLRKLILNEAKQNKP